MPGGATRRSALLWPPEFPSTKTRSKIDNEVRPSTVKTWLTFWRRFPTQSIDHRPRALAVNRMRTPYATIILARRSTSLHPTRPRREMQSFPRPRSSRSRSTSSRGPPENNLMNPTPQLLTGTSVEIVRSRCWRPKCYPAFNSSLSTLRSVTSSTGADPAACRSVRLIRVW